MKPSLLLVGLTLLLAARLDVDAGPEPAYHVAPAPRGDDAHDGTSAAPFATVERARQAVRRDLGARKQTGDIVVEIAAGTYELSEPIRFAPEDSGRDGHAVVYRAAPGAEVILSGGRHVSGWQRDGAGGFSADVGLQIDFRQLWIDGRRAVRARTPNAGQMLKLAGEKQADGFDLPRGLFSGVTVRPNEVEMSVPIAWMHKRLRIARVVDRGSPDSLRAVMAEPEWDAVTKQPQGDRVYLGRSYWLENAPEFLDAPGEFYLDRARGIVRYLPRDDEDVARAEIVRPKLESLIVLAGRLDAPVQHLRFEGLTFAYTGWTRPNRAGFVDVQANSLVPADPTAAVDTQYRHNQRKDRVPAAFQAFTADHIVIRGCRFARLGGTGVMFTHGGDDNVIEGNSFFDLAAGGIEIGEDAARPNSPRLFPRRNRIANNFLAHIGEDYFGSVAILGYYTDASAIAHNEIVNVPYTGISQGWGWGTPPAPADSRANVMAHNLVSNYMRRLDDGGGIYTTDALPGSEITGNILEHMRPPDRRTKAGGALYLDQFTSGVRAHDNVVTDAVRWLFIWNPNIQHNRVERNFADTAAWRNDGKDNVVEPAALLPARDTPPDVQAIRAAAGIEPAFANAREFFAPRRLVFDADSPAFHRSPDDSSPTEECVASWRPVLPRSGDYAVSVRFIVAGAGARCTVLHAGGRTDVNLPVTVQTGWVSLGRFHFQAGVGAEIRVGTSTAAPSRLAVDAVRFERVETSGNSPAR
ncbi:MAG: right-handed parallel beta-helix repeat-containing protein [Candidatus Didemnitutus sp.]|nr:right-handed parallel beta-helix repeat-containing protein [Candidatus Didemnitutus sp.]